MQTKDKFCFIFLHDTTSSYDKNFYEAAEETCKKLNVEFVPKTNIPETEECYNTVKELAEDGCKGIFADSFGHEDHLIKAAKEYPNIQFAHATGTKAHTEKLDNYHNAFASIYEGRYVTGVAAGMKLKEMIDNGSIKEEEAKAGYVGAFPYAEVVSGYTAFFLGIRSILPSATMTVRYTNSWYDERTEAEVARKLIDEDKCKIISQHADSQGAPSVCEEKGVPNVFYNGENTEQPNTYLCSSRINLGPYFEHFIKNTQEGTKIDADFTGTLDDGSVEILKASSIAAPGTQEKMDEVVSDLKSGKIHVFDTSKFTVSEGNDNLKIDSDNHVTSYKADVDTDSNYEGDTEAVSDGYFHESEYRSAPYFDIRIDNIIENSENNGNNTQNEEENVYEIGKNNYYIRNKSDRGLSSGAIAAIVIGIVVAVLATAVVSIFLVKRGSKNVVVNNTAYNQPNIDNEGTVHNMNPK